MWRSLHRPVVPREYERREVDFMRKLDQAPERGRPGIERCRPGIDVRDVLESACQRFQHRFLRF
jgi:hypothetical protein